MSDLKPCPFCGCQGVEVARPVAYNVLDEEIFFVVCENCSCQTPTMDYPEFGVDVWNTRPAEDALNKELTEQAANYENIICEYKRDVKQAVEQIDTLTAEVERLKRELGIEENAGLLTDIKLTAEIERLKEDNQVYRDMEAEGYSCGSVVLGAHSIGAPHQRQRLYWGCTLAGIPDTDTEQRHRTGEARQTGRGESSNGSNGSCRIPHAPCKRCSEERSDSPRSPERSAGTSFDHALAQNSHGGGCGRMHNENPSGDNRKIQTTGLCGDSDRLEFSNSQLGKEQCGSKPNETQQSGLGLPGCINNIPWERYQLIYCQDGAVRRIPAESVFFSVADGFSEGVDGSGNGGISEVDGFPLTKQKEGRPMLLKGYGNAIVPQVASEFIKAFEASIKDPANVQPN